MLNSPWLLRWRPSFLRWLGASDKTGWDWVDLSLKSSVQLTLASLGMVLTRINDDRKRRIADTIQKDAVLREYIKEMTGQFAGKEASLASRAEEAGRVLLAQALTVIAFEQLPIGRAQPMALITSGNLLVPISFRSLRLNRKAHATPRTGSGAGTRTGLSFTTP